MPSEEYVAYINSEAWRGKRQAYFGSKLPQGCRSCGDINVQIHHRTYTRLGRERLNDLEPLCDACHRSGHDLIRRLQSGGKKMRRFRIGRRLLRIKVGRFSGLLPKGWQPPAPWGMTREDVWKRLASTALPSTTSIPLSIN